MHIWQCTAGPFTGKAHLGGRQDADACHACQHLRHESIKQRHMGWTPALQRSSHAARVQQEQQQQQQQKQQQQLGGAQQGSQQHWGWADRCPADPACGSGWLALCNFEPAAPTCSTTCVFSAAQNLPTYSTNAPTCRITCVFSARAAVSMRAVSSCGRATRRGAVGMIESLGGKGTHAPTGWR